MEPARGRGRKEGAQVEKRHKLCYFIKVVLKTTYEYGQEICREETRNERLCIELLHHHRYREGMG